MGQRHVGEPRANALPTKRMADADYMAEPALVQRPKRVWRGSRLRNSLRHGKFTKAKLEKRKANAAKGQEIPKELRQMESDLIAGALLDKHWRDSFPS